MRTFIGRHIGKQRDRKWSSREPTLHVFVAARSFNPEKPTYTTLCGVLEASAGPFIDMGLADPTCGHCKRLRYQNKMAERKEPATCET